MLASKDPDLRIRGAPATTTSKAKPVAQASSVFGNVRYSPNLAAFKQTLSPSQLNLFAMRRATIGEAAQRLFLAEISDKAVVTIDCLGQARVWLVDDLAIREAFRDWRRLVGKADDEPLRIT